MLPLVWKTDTACFSQMPIPTYEFTWHYNPEEQDQHLYYSQNLKLLQCVVQQETVWMNFLQETSSMQVVASVYDLCYLDCLVNELPTILQGVPLATRRETWVLHNGVPPLFSNAIANNNLSEWLGRS